MSEGSILKRHKGGIERSDLGRLLVDALNIPVVVENDASVLAVRQLYGWEVADGDFALILVTEDGVGAAIAVGGRVYRGSQGMAGEIGHLQVCPRTDGLLKDDKLSSSSFGGTCSCGSDRGRHVEAFATPARLKNAFAELGVPDALSDPNVLADAPPEIQGKARELFADAGRALGQGVTSLANVVNPDQMYFVLPESLEVEKMPWTWRARSSGSTASPWTPSSTTPSRADGPASSTTSTTTGIRTTWRAA